jgi:hypothetical protein
MKDTTVRGTTNMVMDCWEEGYVVRDNMQTGPVETKKADKKQEIWYTNETEKM